MTTPTKDEAIVFYLKLKIHLMYYKSRARFAFCNFAQKNRANFIGWACRRVILWNYKPDQANPQLFADIEKALKLGNELLESIKNGEK